MSARQCPQCGSTVEADPTLLSTACAFCETPLVATDASAETVDRVVAFQIPRKRASRLLRQHIEGHWFVHSTLKRAAAPEMLRSVLVPFYVYDAVARSTFSCDVGIYWYRTETYTTYENGKLVTKTRQVRETEWFDFDGSHLHSWDDHLVSASKGLEEAESNALEPFDLGQSAKYEPELVAGWMAEHPTIDHDQARQTAADELAQLEARLIAKRHLPGDTHRSLSSQSTFDIQAVRLYLLPVWVASFRGPKGPVRLLVNGQTGETIGAVPTYWRTIQWVILCVFLVLLVLGGAFFVMVMGASAILGGM